MVNIISMLFILEKNYEFSKQMTYVLYVSRKNKELIHIYE